MKYFTHEEINAMRENGEDVRDAQEFHDRVEHICTEIYKAFENVELGDGIGLTQADGMDDYAPEFELERLRDADEKHDWTKISADDLEKCTPEQLVVWKNTQSIQ